MRHIIHGDLQISFSNFIRFLSITKRYFLVVTQNTILTQFEKITLCWLLFLSHPQHYGLKLQIFLSRVYILAILAIPKPHLIDQCRLSSKEWPHYVRFDLWLRRALLFNFLLLIHLYCRSLSFRLSCFCFHNLINQITRTCKLHTNL